MAQRLNVINSHFSFASHSSPLEEFRTKKINTHQLSEEYNSPLFEISKKFYAATLENPLFNLQAHIEQPRGLQREIILKQLIHLIPKVYSTINSYDSIQRAALGVAFSALDQSVSTRFLVHSILYIETIEFLGTRKHQALIDNALRFKDYGCFAMTEIGHGSNVNQAEVTATFDLLTKEFVINSPTPTSIKWWIGAAANSANRTVVFAQLIVGNTNHGVHVFAIKIRDDQHNPLPGVVIGDCGPKAGLAGIDNGFIIFQNFRVEYDSLLDRISSVTPDGKYKSSIKSKEKRFGIMLSGLTGARAGILGSTEVNMRNALTIAIRYSAVRKQFGGHNESKLISYQLHKYRLMPYLSKCFAARMAYQLIIKLYTECKDLIKTDPEGLKVNEMHALLSVFKYLNGRYSQDCIQECREACGGHGYSAYAGFSRLRENNDIHLTWDGDNNVLIQQCSKFLLKHIISHNKGKPVHSEYITFLNASKPEITKEFLQSPINLISILEYRANYYAKKSFSKLEAADKANFSTS